MELDPGFAIGHALLGMVYSNLGEPVLAAEDMRKAYVLRERLSERERLYIESQYYHINIGDLDKASQVSELYVQIYPRDFIQRAWLAVFYNELGQYDRAIEEAREAVRLDPNAWAGYVNLAGAYLSMNRLDEAQAVLKQAEERKLESQWLLATRYQLAFLKGDGPQMDRMVAQAMGKPGTEDVLSGAQADTNAYHGRLHTARELAIGAADSALRNDAKETAAQYYTRFAMEEAYVGQRQLAITNAEAGLKLAANRPVTLQAALALALVGDVGRAEHLTEGMNREFPGDTMLQAYWLPVIRAAMALQRKNAGRVIELLQQSVLYELTNELEPVYLRGQADLMLHNGSGAVSEFQKIIDHRGIVGNYPLGALARLGLARSYALTGDTAKAKAAYQDFLTLWKDADPDIPILKEAQGEYAKLK